MLGPSAYILEISVSFFLSTLYPTPPPLDLASQWVGFFPGMLCLPGDSCISKLKLFLQILIPMKRRAMIFQLFLPKFWNSYWWGLLKSGVQAWINHFGQGHFSEKPGLTPARRAGSSRRALPPLRLRGNNVGRGAHTRRENRDRQAITTRTRGPPLPPSPLRRDPQRPPSPSLLSPSGLPYSVHLFVLLPSLKNLTLDFKTLNSNSCVLTPQRSPVPNLSSGH